jgi:hypothetical protein
MQIIQASPYYEKLIEKAIGVSDKKVLEKVEEMMRTERPTFNSMELKDINKLAKKAYKNYQLMQDMPMPDNWSDSVNSLMTSVVSTEWWKKSSKVVDSNGELLTVYHGSPFEFDKFDKKRQRKDGSFGPGFYFTDSIKEAEKYGSVKPFNLLIKNPASMADGLAVAFDTNKLQKAGFDGLIIKNKRTGITTFVVFDTYQIRAV